MPSRGRPSKNAKPSKGGATKRVSTAGRKVDAEPARAGAAPFRVIERAMSVLKCLSRHPAGLTLTELSREVDLNKATTLRFLKALGHGAFVAPASAGKAWKVGPAFFEIGARAADQTDIRDVARPIMEEASRACGETVQLAILEDDGVTYVEKVEPADQPLKINSQIGSRRPIHCTGLGKVLATYRDWSEIERILDKAGMSRFTAQTITSPKEFHAELARIRSQGYAVDDREYNQLVVCTATPVRDATGHVVAGLSISTFGVPIQSQHFRRLIRICKEIAAKVSAGLGWAAPRVPQN